MEIIKGIPVSPGFGVSQITRLESASNRVTRRSIGKAKLEQEIMRYHQAVEKTIEQIIGIRDRFAADAGQEYRSIFDAHIQILRDPSLHKKVEKNINSMLCDAGYAVHLVLQDLITTISKIEDEYLSHRAPDIADIEKRLLTNLKSRKKQKRRKISDLSGILVVKNLEPSQTASMTPEKIRAIITETGGPTSHAAIMARALNIPAVLGVKNALSIFQEGQSVIVDGNKGIIIASPSEEMIAKYRSKNRTARSMYRALEKENALSAQTLDGRPITLKGNIEFPSEITSVLRYGAQGIGLYRTEFLSMDRPAHEITEAFQEQTYREALERLKGATLTIRTFDIGADKPGSLWDMGKEENPFLGCRSIRFCFERPKLFLQQLRAILRASAHGKIRLLFPMVSDRSELEQALGYLEKAKRQLDQDNIIYDKKIPVGIMIEVPSAAITADAFAKDVDFFSIGTNDLVQYTIAIDRGNEKIAHMYTPHHLAILRMIRDVLTVGKQHNTPVSLCGEMAGDVNYTMLLIGLGLQEFSVISSTIPQIKRIIRSINYYEARRFADSLLTCTNHEVIKEKLDQRNRSLLPKALRAS